MSRRVMLLGLLAVCAICPAPARSQEVPARRYAWFVAGEFGGAVSPSVFTDYYTFGYGVSFGIEVPVSPSWAMIGRINYKRFAPASSMIQDWWDDEGEYPGSTNIEVSEGTLQVGTLAIQGKGSLKTATSRLFPYVKGGFGLTLGGADAVVVDFVNAARTQQREEVAGADSDVNFSVLLGFGVQKMLGSGNSALFVELGFDVLMLEDSYNPSVVPLTVGVTF